MVVKTKEEMAIGLSSLMSNLSGIHMHKNVVVFTVDSSNDYTSLRRWAKAEELYIFK